MELLAFLGIFAILIYFIVSGFKKLVGKKRKPKSIKENNSPVVPLDPKDPKSVALHNLMNQIEQAKKNHPDLVQDPKRAASILKQWVEKDKTGES